MKLFTCYTKSSRNGMQNCSFIKVLYTGIEKKWLNYYKPTVHCYGLVYNKFVVSSCLAATMLWEEAIGLHYRSHVRIVLSQPHVVKIILAEWEYICILCKLTSWVTRQLDYTLQTPLEIVIRSAHEVSQLCIRYLYLMSAT